MNRAAMYRLITSAMRVAHPLTNRSAVARERIEQHSRDCEALAIELSVEHESFDRGRFLKDCGVNP